MFALILDSLGSTEFLFILVIALIFFGPRKLPQLARSMGKGLAEFRKASDDFKQTWEREVALESVKANGENTIHGPLDSPELEDSNLLEGPQLEPANVELAVPRENPVQTAPETLSESADISGEATQPEPLRKHDWL